jgi:hypothetical protein
MSANSSEDGDFEVDFAMFILRTSDDRPHQTQRSPPRGRLRRRFQYSATSKHFFSTQHLDSPNALGERGMSDRSENLRAVARSCLAQSQTTMDPKLRAELLCMAASFFVLANRSASERSLAFPAARLAG